LAENERFYNTQVGLQTRLPVERIVLFPSRLHLFDCLARSSCGMVLLSHHIANVTHGESSFCYGHSLSRSSCLQ
jgi:hypothetical protein